MKKTYSSLVVALLALALIASAAIADSAADNWPSGNITVYVPATAGGGTDAFARILTGYLERATNATFSVINEFGGNGAVASEAVRNAKPDGKTLMVFHPTMLIQYYQDMYEMNPTDTKNFTAIATLQNGGDGDVLVVPADAPYNTVEELVAYCKENPRKVIFGNQNGGFGQMETMQFMSLADIQIGFVDSGAQADTITALLGGNINACFISLASALQYQEAGDMKILAICNAEPSIHAPEVPTFRSLGYDVMLKIDMVLLGPGNMDPDLVAKINETVKGMAEDEESVRLNANMNNSFTPVDPVKSQEDWNAIGQTIKNMIGLIGYDVSNK